MSMLIVGLSTVLLVFRGDNGVVLLKPECVDSNTVNKRMSTSWGMTQPLPRSKWMTTKTLVEFCRRFYSTRIQTIQLKHFIWCWAFFGGSKCRWGIFFSLPWKQQTSQRKKKKTLSSSSCHSTSNKRVTTALKRHFRRSNASVAWW